jgi:hypothetical protein
MTGQPNTPLKVCALVLALAPTLILSGCKSWALNHEIGRGSAESYVGWVRFVGEFVLYDDQSAFESFGKNHCMSGALPLEKQRLASRFSGTRVKVTGVRVRWSLPDPSAVSLNNDGSPITNWCGGEFVLFARDMVPD